MTESQIISSVPRCVWRAGRRLGEGGWWSPEEQAFYWLDIKDPAILRLDPVSECTTIWPMPEMIGCFAPVKGGGLICAFASGVYHVELGLPGEIPDRKLLFRPDAYGAGDRFNDGKVHPDGSFWVGTMDDAEEAVRGYYYCLSTSGIAKKFAGPYKVCNGPAFSPDGRYVYLSDSAARIVHRIDLQAHDPVPKPFLRFGEDAGYPDGCTTDVEGRLWVAFWDGGRVACFDADSGLTLAEIPMPIARPTSVSFGGANLSTIYITTARADAGSHFAHPGGDLYAVDVTGARGWPVTAYRPV